MSSGVTIDWRAERERERQACITLQAELAQLRQRERELRRRRDLLRAAHGTSKLEVRRVAEPAATAGSAQLRAAVNEAHAGLAKATEAIEAAIVDTTRRVAAQSAASYTSSASAAGPVTSLAPAVDLSADAAISRSAPSLASRAPAPSTPGGATERAEADAIIQECRLRCPDHDLADLVSARTEMDRRPAAAGELLWELRVRATQHIQKAKREQVLEERRQRLLALVQEAVEQEGAELTRRVTVAAESALTTLEAEVADSVQRASAARSRAQAVHALRTSLTDLGYGVGDSFDSLLPEESHDDVPPVVVPSRHSPDHGLRIRLDADKAYVSVVRVEGSAAALLARLDPQATIDGHDPVRETDIAAQVSSCADLQGLMQSSRGSEVELVVGVTRAPGNKAPEMACGWWAPPTQEPNTGQTVQAEDRQDGTAEEDAAQAQRQRYWQQQTQSAARERRQDRPVR